MRSNFIFHHLGIATKSIIKCGTIYKELGYNMTPIKVETQQNVKICFLSKIGSPLLELVEPLTNESPISRIVIQSGTTPYHICYEVEDIKKSINELKKLNFRPLFKPQRSESMENGLICYLFSVETGLIELFQKYK